MIDSLAISIQIAICKLPPASGIIASCILHRASTSSIILPFIILPRPSFCHLIMLPLLHGAKSVDGGLTVGLVWTQNDKWEVGIMDGIGEVLGFQAETVAFGVEGASFATEGSVHVVAGVKLDATLDLPRRIDLPTLKRRERDSTELAEVRAPLLRAYPL